MIDIASLLQQLTGNNNQRTALMDNEANRQGAVTDQIARNNQLLTAATQNQISEQTQLNVDSAGVQAQNAMVNEQAQQIAGLNPDDPNNIFVQRMADYTSAEEKRKQVRQQYDRLAGATLLSDPLGWLEAQVALPQIVAQNNSLVAARDAAAEEISTRQTLLAKQKSTVVANTASQVKQLAVRDARLKQQQANIQLLEIESKQASDVAGRRLNEANLREGALRTRNETLNTVLTIEDLQIRRDERRESREALAEERATRMKNKDEEASAMAEANLNLQRVSQFLGLPSNVTFQQLNSMALPQDVKQVISVAALSGSLGSSPWEAVETIRRVPTASANIATNNPQFAQTLSNMNNTVEGFATTILAKNKAENGGVIKMKSDEAVRRGFDEWENEITQSANFRDFPKPMNHSSWDAQYNPYRVDHTLMLDVVNKGNAKFLEANPFVAALQTVKTTMKPDQDRFTGEDETKALLLMGERVKRREISAKDGAAAIAAYYNAGKYIQADKSQYGILGLPLNKRYHVQLPAVGVWGKPVTADLLNPLEAEKALLELGKSTQQRSLDGLTQNAGAMQMVPGLMGMTSLYRLMAGDQEEQK